MGKISFEEEVRLYMGEKYGEEFLESFEIVDTYYDTNTTHGNMVANTVSSLLPERKIKVVGYPKVFYRRDKTMKYRPKKFSVISDDYVVLYRKDELLEYFEKYLDGIYEKFSVSDIDVGETKTGIPYTFDFDTDIEQILDVTKKDELFVNISVKDDMEKSHEQFEEVISRLKKLRKNIRVWVWYILDNEEEDGICYLGEYENKKIKWNRLK